VTVESKTGILGGTAIGATKSIYGWDVLVHSMFNFKDNLIESSKAKSETNKRVNIWRMKLNKITKK